MKNKSIIIIGGGIAGLSAGCYAQMNGFDTQIFEKHNIPGGLCTSWKRKGFTIDGCIHWLVGTGKKSRFYKIWNELGALVKNDIINHDYFLHIKDKHGKVLKIYTNLIKLKEHLLEIAPEDKKTINEFIKNIEIFKKYELPIGKPMELYNIIDYLKLLKHIPILISIIKYKNVSLFDFSKRFKNKFLRENFSKIFDLDELSLIIVFFHLAWMDKKASGYPIGGSLKFAKSIEKKYKELGGNINYNVEIKKIITKNNKAIGILTKEGIAHYSDIIISSSDGNSTINKLLDKEHITDELLDNYKNLTPFPSLIQISLGLDMDLSNEPHFTVHQLEKPINIGGKEHALLKIEHSAFDKTMSPKGKSLMKAMFYADYEYWKNIYGDSDKYKKEKEKIVDIVIDAIETIYPNIKSKIEMIDFATPMTYKRYTGNYKGSFEGWQIDTKSIDVKLNKEIPGLNNFYMTGHWIAIGGGVPLVALASRDLIQIICKKEKKSFKSN